MVKHGNVFKDAYNRTLGLVATGAPLPSEAELCRRLGVSRTTVRLVLGRLEQHGLVRWSGREKRLLRMPAEADYFDDAETMSTGTRIEEGFMAWLMRGDMAPGGQFSEIELARAFGVATGGVREFLIRFSRFGLIEKRRNSHWLLKGFTRDFAMELLDIRELFEKRGAAAFMALPGDHPARAQLAAVEVEHRLLEREFDARHRDFSQLDERLHRLVHSASGNRFVIDFFDVIAMVFHYHYQWSKGGERERTAVALAEHLDYIAGLRSGDAGAMMAACERHLASARATLLRSIALDA